MRPKDWARARAYLHDGKEMYKRCDACALLLHGNKRSLYLLTQRNYGIIRETQFLLWQKTNTRKLFMMPGPYSNDLRWHTICLVALWDPLRWRNAKHYAVSHPISLNTMVVYLLSFRKIQLESKTLFGSFQRKISGSNRTSEKVVLFSRTECSKRKFVLVIPVSGIFFAPFFGKWNRFVEICTNGKSDSWAKFSCWEGRLEGFKVSLWILNITKLIEYRTEQLRNATIFIIVVDGCIIIHDSRGCHVQFY